MRYQTHQHHFIIQIPLYPYSNRIPTTRIFCSIAVGVILFGILVGGLVAGQNGILNGVGVASIGCAGYAIYTYQHLLFRTADTTLILAYQTLHLIEDYETLWYGELHQLSYGQYTASATGLPMLKIQDSSIETITIGFYKQLEHWEYQTQVLEADYIIFSKKDWEYLMEYISTPEEKEWKRKLFIQLTNSKN